MSIDLGISVSFYACELDANDLPTDGLSWNGNAISGLYQCADYIQRLNRDETVKFLAMIQDETVYLETSSMEEE